MTAGSDIKNTRMPLRVDELKVVDDYPPIYDKIKAVFPVKAGVIYSWGRTVYAPGSKGTIPPELMRHELVHGQRQLNDIEGWWEQYLHDPEFRLQEEIPAHQAEYRYILEYGNRNQKRVMLKEISKRLASPLYGNMITPKDAKKIIQDVLNGDR